MRLLNEQRRGTDGRPRIHASRRLEGTPVSDKRLAGLMGLAALGGVSRRKQPGRRERRKATPPAPDLVHRQFTATAPNKLWVAASCAGYLPHPRYILTKAGVSVGGFLTVLG